MHDIDFLQDLAILLPAAGVAGLLCKRLGLSVVVGYLIAGIAIGPQGSPFSFVTDETRIKTLSQIGLVFLMFGIGLGFRFSSLRRLGAETSVASVFGAAGTFLLALATGPIVGWTPFQAMVVAAMLVASSPTVIARIVNEQRLAHERSSQTAIKVNMIEGVVAVAMLTIFAGQATTTAPDANGLGRLLGGLGAFAVLLTGAGLILIPCLMRRLENRADSETQTVIVGGVLFALALMSVKAGYSIALGAFIFGAIVAEIPQKSAIETPFRGMRDVFGSVFFVSTGMMIDLRPLADAWPMVLALGGLVLLARPLACGLALVLAGTPPAEARRAGLLLTPLGEFTFIIAQLGVSAAILPESYYPVAVGTSLLTMLAAPVMVRHREVLLRAMRAIEPNWLTQGLEAYHAWFLEVRSRRSRTPLWSLLKPRLGQVAWEVLFVSGILVLAEILFEFLVRLASARTFGPATVGYVFWPLVAAVVLVSCVAIWRNCSALAMLVAETSESPHLPRAVIERALNAAVAPVMAAWLVVLLPHAPFAQWGWLLIALGGIVAAVAFSRQLVRWHSHWQVSVREALAARRADPDEMRANARAALGANLEAWNVVLGEATLPPGSTHEGRTLAELAFPAQFDTTVIEVERNGFSVRTPAAEFALYPGDTVLLAGPADKMHAARSLLEASASGSHAGNISGDVVLGTSQVFDEQIGKSLGELQLATRTGVRVIGIEREGHRIVNPPAAERLQRDDALLVLGTLDGIGRFKKARRRISLTAQGTAMASQTGPDHG